MRFSVKFLLLVLLLVAMFCAGWVAKTNHYRWQAKELGGSDVAAPVFVVPPPMVDGVVLRTKNDLAAISIGTDDGLAVNAIVNFYDGEKPLGRGQITTAKSNMAAVKMLGKTSVSEGDYVRLQ